MPSQAPGTYGKSYGKLTFGPLGPSFGLERVPVPRALLHGSAVPGLRSGRPFTRYPSCRVDAPTRPGTDWTALRTDDSDATESNTHNRLMITTRPTSTPS